jgi:hypothetical protein
MLVGCVSYFNFSNCFGAFIWVYFSIKYWNLCNVSSSCVFLGFLSLITSSKFLGFAWFDLLSLFIDISIWHL